MSKLVFASVISEIQQSDVFMTVKARICEAPEANLNGARVTEGFIDEIVSNEKRYVGLPLYADVKALTNGNYNRLGHLYDAKTGEFHSTQIGSFYKFEKQATKTGCALIGYARIPKRNKKLSKAISELFTENALKFSFELSVGEYEELDDETILIDASENNYLEGTAIVTYPACEEAVALELVAQTNTDDCRKGETEMAEVENKAEVIETEAVQSQQAEKQVEVKAEAENAEAETKTAETETATVYIDTHSVQVDEQSAYDSETGKSINQKVIVETMSTQPVEGTLVEATDGVHVAEADGDTVDEGGSGTTEPSEDDSESGGENGSGEDAGESETNDDPAANGETNQDSYESKKTAELAIAELMEAINQLKQEIAELKEQKHVAEAKSVPGEANPFMGSLPIEGSGKKYTLLEAESKQTQKYSLL